MFKLKKMNSLIKDVKKDVQLLKEEWQLIKDIETADNNLVNIPLPKLEQLQQEVTQIKQSLPKLSINMREVLKTATDYKEDLSKTQKCLEDSRKKEQHMRSRLQAIQAECDNERKKKLTSEDEMNKISEQLCLQSEYCASMGAVSCTLLWRASQQEQVIPTLIAGSQMKSFLSVVCHTLGSFLATYEEEELPSEMTEEIQFVLALVGTVTNVAASAIGREFLASCSQCRSVLDTFVSLLGRPPSKQNARLKNLALMCLYNLSINQKGLKLLTTIKGLAAVLAWVLNVEEADDIRLHTLLLLHSLVLEPGNLNLLLEAKEGLSPTLLENLCCSSNQDIREVTMEIKEAIKVLTVEQ